MVASVVALVAILAAISSIVVRFRRSGGNERQQIKWMTFAVVVLPVSLALGAALAKVFPDSPLGPGLFAGFQLVAAMAIPIAATVAIVRYRLYNIDIIINRSLVYGALTLLMVGLHALLLGALNALFQSEASFAISIVATGVVAVLFQPVRDRLQRVANRLLFGWRDEPYDVLSRLGRQLDGPTAPEAMISSIVETVAQTLKLPHVAIALPTDRGHEIVSEHGTARDGQITFTLVYRGVDVGRLVCAPRSPRERFTSLEQRLL